jgi:hypothetical protein
MNLSRGHGRALARRLLPALGLILAGCGATPAPPPMVPLAEAGTHGYFERQTGPDLREVGYLSRAGRNASAGPGNFELILWRSAEIAEREGYPAFRVERTRADAATHVEHPGADPYWGPGGPSHWGPVSRAQHYWPDHGYQPRAPVVVTQARLAADIRLLEAAGPGDYRAAEVIAQARRAYPDAAGAPSG